MTIGVPTSFTTSVRPIVDSAVGQGVPLLVKLVIIAMFLPIELSFQVGETRITLTRVLLLVISPWVVLKYIIMIAERPASTSWSDWAVLPAAIWFFVAFFNTMPERAVNFAGAAALEFSIVYALARVMLTTAEQVKGAARFLCVVIAVVGAFSILDVLANSHLLRNAANLMTGGGQSRSLLNLQTVDLVRLGLLRATSTIDHPILLGTVTAMALIIVIKMQFPMRVLVIIGCAIGCFLSISSGPWAGLGCGLLLLAYERTTRQIGSRWLLLACAIAVPVTAIFVFHPSPWGFLFNFVTLSAATAWYRVLVWEAFLPFVAQSPWVGIGLIDVTAVAAGLSPTIDAHFLYLSILFGIPGMVLCATTLLGCNSNSTRYSDAIDDETRTLALGLSMALFVYVFIGTTVAFFGAAWMLGPFIAGMRASLGALAVQDRNG